MPSSGVKTCALDRKSTRLNSSHTIISYAVFCLKKSHRSGVQGPALLAQHRDRQPSGRRSLRHAEAHARLRVGRRRRLFFNDTATTEIYTLSLHDALPI